MTLLYEICTVDRFPKVKDFMSYCRLVRPKKTSAGKPTDEAGGKKMGNRHLEWAFSEAALLLVRESPDVKKSGIVRHSNVSRLATTLSEATPRCQDGEN